MNENYKDYKVFLADIVSKTLSLDILEDRMRELENLVETYGWVVIVKKYQRKDTPDPNTYIGKGKFQEIIEEMKASWANLLIIGNALKPAQLYKINELLRPIGATARDRVDLILKIFDKHAQEGESQLQIELASIKHMGPRIYGMGMELSRQWGGSGWSGGSSWSRASRWQGETNTEIMKRHLKDKIQKIQEKLKEYENMRRLHRDSRKKKWLPTVGIVGYTNAGKSSLLNAMTNKGVLAENKLFATLGTNVGKIRIMKDPVLGTGKEILLNDTIGFIRDLPPKLIKAFSSTLEDSIESELLLHVVDAGDAFIHERIDVVNNILDEIGANQPRILVFNKIDTIDEKTKQKLQEHYAGQDQLRISAQQGIGLEEVKQLLADRLV
jgi:GTP-binding protein HflX